MKKLILNGPKIVVTKQGIIALCPAGVAQKTPVEELAAITHGHPFVVDGFENVIYNQECGVIVFGNPLRGKDKDQKQLAAEFSSFYAAFDEYAIFDNEGALRTTPEWDAWLKRLYHLTTSRKTIVNVKGVMLSITRHRGTVKVNVMLLGYKVTMSNGVLFNSEKLDSPTWLASLWTHSKNRTDSEKRCLSYALDKNCYLYPAIKDILLMRWPDELKPKQYRSKHVFENFKSKQQLELVVETA